ncbi:MAG: pentapeptide repeat-containing protein [Thermodesulfobacteriota bacterium]
MILDLEAGMAQARSHEIPYTYQTGDEGWRVLALDPGDPYLTRATLFDAGGRRVATVTRDSGAVRYYAGPGAYRLEVVHDATVVPAAGSVAFIRQKKSQGPAVPAKAGLSTLPSIPAYPAYVAFTFGNTDQKGNFLVAREEESFLWALAAWQSDEDFTSMSHLFGLEQVQDLDWCSNGSYPPFAEIVDIHLWAHDDNQHLYFTMEADCGRYPDVCPASQNNQPISGELYMPAIWNGDTKYSLYLQDTGQGSFVLWTPTLPIASCSPLYLAENNIMYYYAFTKDKTFSPATLALDPRFVYYKDGTVIDRSKLTSGQVALYSEPNYAGTAVILNSSFDTVEVLNLFDVKSIAYGLYTDTTVAFYRETNLHGDPELTVAMNTPNMDLAAADIGSISVFASDKTLIATKQCPYCNLAGVVLDGDDISGANLCFANLMAASMAHCSLTGTDMANAVLSGANLKNANCAGAGFLNAVLTGNGNLQLSAAVLSGAYLRNANMYGTNLSGVDFTNASFHSTPNDPSGCSPDPDNPDFSNGCSSAQNATLSNANFTGAYLAGLDLSGAQGNEVNFSGAVLSGARLNGSSFSWDPGTQVGSSFQGAFLDGVDLTVAHFDKCDFSSAYVTSDPSKNCVMFSLPASHADFPGYQTQYGSTPCVLTATPGATTYTALDDSCFCPDGTVGPCSNAAWQNPTTPRDQAQPASGYCTDDPPLCTFSNLYFGW